MYTFQMNTHPIPAVTLSTSAVAAIARRRAEGVPWSVLADESALPPESRPDLDLLPLFHPDWRAAYAAAARQCERDTYAEAQLVTRRLLKVGTDEARLAARKRVAVRPTRRGTTPEADAPLVVIPGNTLAFRLARGETVASIVAAYRAGIAGAG